MTAVRWSPPALKDIKRLDKKVAKRVFEAIDRFAETGEGDVKKLKGSEDQHRLRVGKWRVRFRKDGEDVVIQRVLSRGKAYRG